VTDANEAQGSNVEELAAVVRSYIELIGQGTSEQVSALFADDAVMENPVGGDVYRGMEEIRSAFHAMMDGADSQVELISLNVAGGEAAVHMQVRRTNGQCIDVIDVMTFSDGAKIASLRAYWGPSNIATQ
jgi:steroid delta-isomerase